MSNYTKEKNIITITIDGMSGAYRFDINTGVLYGVRGNPITTNPKRGVMSRLLNNRSHENDCVNPNLCYALSRVVDHYSDTRYYARRVDALKAADKLDALGLPALYLCFEDYITLGDNIKTLRAYIAEYGINDFDMYNFKYWVKFEEQKKSLGALANLFTPKMYFRVTDRLPNATRKELEVCAHYLVKCMLWEYEGEYVSKLTDYITWCRDLGKVPEKTNNFTREYVETLRTWKAYKEEYDRKRLVASYAKQSKAWEFAYGDCIVVIPTTGQDIVREGMEMHHCVGNYVGRVTNGEQYICFVRHKDTPNIPYITCQVYLNGTIGQYYLAYDRLISKDEDFEFRKAFAEHLQATWNTEQ